VTSDMTLPAAFHMERPKELVAFVGGGGKTSLMFALAQALDGRVITTTTTRIFAAQMKLAPRVRILTAEDAEGVEEEGGAKSVERRALAGERSAPFLLVVGDVQGEKALGVGVEWPGRWLAMPEVDYVLVEADGARMRPCKAPAEHEPVIPPEATLVVPVVGIDALNGRIEELCHRPERVSALTGLGVDEWLTPAALATLLAHEQGSLKGVPAGARVIPFVNKVETEAQTKAARQVARLALREARLEQVVIGAVQRERPVREVYRRVTAVVLAAGQGSRMGQTKQLMAWGETTVLGQTLGNVKESAAFDTLLVSGHNAEAVEAIAAEQHVRAVYNPRYAEGEMLSSLQTAVRHLPANIAAVLVMLADQPMVEPATIDQILGAFWEGKGELVVSVYQGQRGNPVLIGRRYFEELLALTAGAAPRDLLRRHQDYVYLVEVGSDAILRDLDRPEEYERWRPGR
jgi:molybdenum cofactor cytidylyltransferase